jgi:hypothetical protein
MVYPCFYYSLKAIRAFRILMYYTTKDDISKYKYTSMWIIISHVRLFLGLSAVVLHVLSTVFLAVQDPIELMMKLVESIVISQTMFEYYLMRSNFQKFINLVNLMKMSFSTIDANIVRSCKKEEKVWFLTFLVLTSAGKYTHPF